MGGILALALSAPVLAQQAPPQAGQRQQAPPQAGQRQQARERQIGAMFLRLDKNQDAAVSKDEWPRGEQAFTRLDVNQDGVLSQEELRRAATPRQVMQQRIRARMVQRQLRRMDVNQDRTITRDEWKGRPELFDRIDADKSGTLTASEIRQFRARQRGGRAR